MPCQPIYGRQRRKNADSAGRVSALGPPKTVDLDGYPAYRDTRSKHRALFISISKFQPRPVANKYQLDFQHDTPSLAATARTQPQELIRSLAMSGGKLIL